MVTDSFSSIIFSLYHILYIQCEFSGVTIHSNLERVAGRKIFKWDQCTDLFFFFFFLVDFFVLFYFILFLVCVFPSHLGGQEGAKALFGDAYHLLSGCTSLYHKYKIRHMFLTKRHIRLGCDHTRPI